MRPKEQGRKPKEDKMNFHFLWLVALFLMQATHHPDVKRHKVMTVLVYF